MTQRIPVPDSVTSAILERDMWICSICGVAIARDRKKPHSMSPSIDHVLPVARGGTNDEANLAAAHLSCNSSKGANGRRGPMSPDPVAIDIGGILEDTVQATGVFDELMGLIKKRAEEQGIDLSPVKLADDMILTPEEVGDIFDDAIAFGSEFVAKALADPNLDAVAQSVADELKIRHSEEGYRHDPDTDDLVNELLERLPNAGASELGRKVPRALGLASYFDASPNDYGDVLLGIADRAGLWGGLHRQLADKDFGLES